MPPWRIPLPAIHDLSYIITTVTKTCFLLHLFTEHVLTLEFTGGPSMLATLSAYGDGVLVSHLHRQGRGVQVGDVVDFKHPMMPGFGAIKRVVGMPGNFVMRDSPGLGKGGATKMIQVPEGHCWLLGDNLSASRDSRTYGPLPLALIKGKVLARVWPWGERKWIGNSLQTAEDK